MIFEARFMQIFSSPEFFGTISFLSYDGSRINFLLFKTIIGRIILIDGIVYAPGAAETMETVAFNIGIWFLLALFGPRRRECLFLGTFFIEGVKNEKKQNSVCVAVVRFDVKRMRS
jgi:hypothetical protein